MNRALPAALVLSIAGSGLLAGCGSSAPDPDGDFKIRLQGHYQQMIDSDDWPSVISSAHQSCDRLTGINPPPWQANLLVIETQGSVDEQTADHVARAGIDVYCPAATPLVPPDPSG